MIRKTGWWLSTFLALAGVNAVGAESNQGSDLSDYFFHRGQYETALSSGVMFSPIGADKNRHTVDYTLSGLEFGWMLSDVGQPGWLRGNWEVAGEAIGGAVWKGEGSYLAGATAWVRYNFVQPDWRWVPYLQTGVGAEGTDMDQRLIGEKFNFNLDVGAGVRCFMAHNWALDFECLYQHISNARISNRDIGINAVGPMIGISYFF